MNGIGLAVTSLQSKQYLPEMVSSVEDPLVNDKNVRVKNILVVDNNGNVIDSLLEEYAPREREDKSTEYVHFQDL